MNSRRRRPPHFSPRAREPLRRAFPLCTRIRLDLLYRSGRTVGASRFVIVRARLAINISKSFANWPRGQHSLVPGLWIVAGPNGSGKSTLTAFFGRGRIKNLIDPDAIARRLSPEDPTKSAIAAGREAIVQCRLLLQQRESFVVETTLSGNGTITMMRQARDAGYRISVVYIALGYPDDNIERVRTRVAEGGHDVPDADVRRRFTRSLAQAPIAAELADKALVIDNKGLRPRRVLLFRTGRVVWQAGNLPAWARELRDVVEAAG